MKILKNIALLAILIAFVNCSSYKAKKQEAVLDLPKLGTIVTTKGGALYDAAEEIGLPGWQNLKVEVQELPFNIDSYVTYATYMQKAGKINTIPFNDSLRYKPKYLKFKLEDKIGLTTLLNNESHSDMARYLSLDDNNRIVTSLKVAFIESDVALFLKADALQLQKDKFDNIIIALVDNGKESSYYLKDLPIFDYGLSAFCWGEDRYHNLEIKNIVSEDIKCPKSTYLKASKIKSDKSYLKF